ncbi:MAG: hypothetical protein A2Y17_01400 [Clostridiales bacterium GWF2_38_85]|nr:MAG: hypothetical protein A2Y17_01400 [Clostridiales bacterium GWF2_38_85]HBL85176.1 hypothetical protein [Clostridiales bacterium]
MPAVLAGIIYVAFSLTFLIITKAPKSSRTAAIISPRSKSWLLPGSFSGTDTTSIAARSL